MQLFIKALLSVLIILTAAGIAKKFPLIGGLIAVMPLTGAVVLTWVYLENKGNPAIVQSFAKAALWGLLPSILFFLTAFLCFKKETSLFAAISLSFSAWFAGAVILRWFLR